MSRVSVVGLGYLGLTHAVAMAEMGHDVQGVELNPARFAQISSGVSPIYEPRVQELLKKHLASGKLVVRDGAGEYLDQCDVHFLCVGTPQDEVTGQWNLAQLFDAFLGILPHTAKDSVIVGKSTVPVGTSSRLVAAGIEFGFDENKLCWSPEFLQEGRALEDSLSPSRLVVGALNEDTQDRVIGLYQKQVSQGMAVIKTDWQTAEMAKAAANSFLAMKISYINSFSSFAAAKHVDLVDLSKILGLDSRIGPSFLRPGLGFGGGCLPKDLRGFYHSLSGEEAGLFDYLLAFDEINLRQRLRFVKLIDEWLLGVTGKRIALLGASFKPGTDDLRDSPSMAVAKDLLERGAEVRLHDPVALENVGLEAINLSKFQNLEECVNGVDLVAIGTDWPQFEKIDPVWLGTVVKGKRMLDGRYMLDLDKWVTAGWEVKTLSSND